MDLGDPWEVGELDSSSSFPYGPKPSTDSILSRSSFGCWRVQDKRELSFPSFRPSNDLPNLNFLGLFSSFLSATSPSLVLRRSKRWRSLDSIGDGESDFFLLDLPQCENRFADRFPLAVALPTESLPIPLSELSTNRSFCLIPRPLKKTS